MGCGPSKKNAQVAPEPPPQPTPKDNGAPEDVKPPGPDELPGEPKVKDDTIKLFVHAFLKDHFVESYLVLDQHEGLVKMLGKKNSPLDFYTAMPLMVETTYKGDGASKGHPKREHCLIFDGHAAPSSTWPQEDLPIKVPLKLDLLTAKNKNHVMEWVKKYKTEFAPKGYKIKCVARVPPFSPEVQRPSCRGLVVARREAPPRTRRAVPCALPQTTGAGRRRRSAMLAQG